MPPVTRRRHITRFRSERGQAAVEFAMVAPILIVLLLAIVQCGITFSHYLAVTDAARAAARKAVIARVESLTQPDITTAADNAAADLDTSQLNVNVQPLNWAKQPAGSTFTVTVTYPYEINVLGYHYKGDLTSVMTERLE
jgi:Flp pilus assembly protein TadG